MMFLPVFMVLATAALVQCQRPTFAGSRPIGYPELATTEGLEDRFGEVDGTTPRLPIEANGDRDLVDRLSKLPIDKQPFWFINWQALEAHRQNPQTYPQRPNTFNESPLNTGASNSNIGTTNSGTTGNWNSGNTGANSASSFSAATSSVNRPTPNIANRFAESATPNTNSANRNWVTSSSAHINSAGSVSTDGSLDPSTASNVHVISDRHGGIEPNNFDSKIHKIYSSLGSQSSN